MNHSRKLSHFLGMSALLACVVGTACSDDTTETPPDDSTPLTCTSTDEDFAEAAIVAVLGRRPSGVDEVRVIADLLRALRERDGDSEARRGVAIALSQSPEYRVRWANFFMDSLQVARTQFLRDEKYSLVQSTACYGAPSATPALGPELAEFVRDQSPSAGAPPVRNFTLGMLLNSAISLDDLSPIYRAHLFHMMSFPLPGANVEPEALERSRRNAFAIQFEEAYLNRNPSCLPCHNSEFSVTADRTFPMRGKVEEALYGRSDAPGDPLSYRSVFRTVGVINGSRAPWGWDADQCGAFDSPSNPDPLGYSTRFGSVGLDPVEAERASVWQLELALANGLKNLRNGFDVDENNMVPDPDEALARLLVTSIVEQVWTEVMGSPLTIAHHFPRNEGQRDVLEHLVGRFSESGYSLRQLLGDIASNPLFGVAPTSDGCWDSMYSLDPILDPFATSDPDPSRRGNGPGDRVVMLSTRVLLSSTHVALGWAPPQEIPTSEEEEAWQGAVGIPLNVDEKGFRGFDLQARLAWEARYGACDAGVEGDFIDQLLLRAEQVPSATVEDVVLALKDRLWTEPVLEDESERSATAELLGVALTGRDFASSEPGLRLYCGALVASPQFMLGGVGDGLHSAEAPLLTDPGDRYDSVCMRLQERLASTLPLACGVEEIELL